MTAGDADILDALPHRPPFRFVTRILDLSNGESGDAIWAVNGDEPFLSGHFPDEPIVPGVLISEALAQLSGLVGFHRPDVGIDGPASAKASARLVHVEVRFHEAVVPPAQIHLRSRASRIFGPLHYFDVLARVDDRKVAKGQLALATPSPPPGSTP